MIFEEFAKRYTSARAAGARAKDFFIEISGDGELGKVKEIFQKFFPVS